MVDPVQAVPAAETPARSTWGIQATLTPNGRAPQGAIRAFLVGFLGLVLLGWVFFRPAFAPSPLEVLDAFPPLFAQGLAYHLYVSLTTNLQAVAISCLLMIPLAWLTVLPAMRPIVELLSRLRSLGVTGLVLPFTVIFGGGHALKVSLLVFGMSFFLLASLCDIVGGISREEFDLARTLRMGPWRSTLEVVVLGRIDAVIDAVRQNAAMGWVMLTMVEGLVRFEGGLGAMLLAEDKHLRLDSVGAIMIVVLVLGILQDWGFLAFRRFLCPYAEITRERR